MTCPRRACPIGVVCANPLPKTGGKSGLLICKHDRLTRARKMRRDVRALTARNHPEGRFGSMSRHALNTPRPRLGPYVARGGPVRLEAGLLPGNLPAVYPVTQNGKLGYGERRCGFNTKHQSTKVRPEAGLKFPRRACPSWCVAYRGTSPIRKRPIP